MRADVDEEQDENIFFLLVEKQEVILQMTFADARELALKFMIVIAQTERLIRSQ